MASQVQRNIAHLVEQNGLNSRSAAHAVGVSQPTVYRVIRGVREPSLDTVAAFAEFFGMTVDDLLTRDLVAESTDSATVSTDVQTPATSVPKAKVITRRKGFHMGVPNIPASQIGDWREIVDNPSSPSAGVETVFKSAPAGEGFTFCTLVEGDSMNDPGSGISYRPGDLIFVDANRKPKPGDRVIAWLGGSRIATFKQYLEEDGRRQLKAINQNWKPLYIDLTEQDHIIGVVVGKWVAE